jgi:Rrf2 family cysteine metabolism transcriptional repressor
MEDAMRISARAEYACLALTEMARARAGRPVPRRVREIAEAQGIPEYYLVQIMQQLKAASMVQSIRGADGGYSLARAAESITVAEVIAAIEGPGELAKRSESIAADRLSGLLEQARQAERGVLAGVTIADLAGAVTAPDWVL